jgi:hypothetical protein
MTKDPIRGKTLSFMFDDGVMSGRAFVHRFAENGTLTFHTVSGSSEAGRDMPGRWPSAKYEVAQVRDDVWAVSYLSSAGYTLTVVLDFATKKLVAFSSNDKTLAVQHGSFEETSAAAESKLRNGTDASAPRH